MIVGRRTSPAGLLDFSIEWIPIDSERVSGQASGLAWTARGGTKGCDSSLINHICNFQTDLQHIPQLHLGIPTSCPVKGEMSGSELHQCS